MSNKQAVASSGVEALLDRLRNDGIAAGQDQAESLVANAQKRAEWIVETAELEAKELIEQAQQQAEDIKQSGQDALQLAARDAFLKLRDNLLGSFSDEVMRVVGEQMQDKAYTRDLILALAGKVREKSAIEQSRALEIHLPEDVIGVDELRQNPEELTQGYLSEFTASIAADLLRSGVNFQLDDDIKAGLSIRLVDEAIIIDFTDETVSTLLLEHLQPRFRALLQGMVK